MKKIYDIRPPLKPSDIIYFKTHRELQEYNPPKRIIDLRRKSIIAGSFWDWNTETLKQYQFEVPPII